MVNKYNAVRTWSNLCNREFASKAEARRGEELKLLELAGEISGLEYQPKFTLSAEPRITVTLDFRYIRKAPLPTGAVEVYEDVKGVLTRDSRTKYAWLQEKYGVKVEIIK